MLLYVIFTCGSTVMGNTRFYVAMTRTKNRVYIATPKNKPSRFLVELIKDNQLPHDEINMETVDLFSLRCPVCGFPLKYEFNRNYGLSLWICTNEVEVCDFMTNDKVHKHDILKCSKCSDGYMIVKKNSKNGDVFYGCTNYFRDGNPCKNMIPSAHPQRHRPLSLSGGQPSAHQEPPEHRHG